jgi:HD-GYP domain-containing protein (c-di-GMP phosphodiesterase class II)
MTNKISENSIDFHDIIECLVATLEARDPYTSGHSSRVADYSLLIGRTIGITGRELERIHIGSHLHDIGKMGIPESILQKPTRLTREEMEIVKEHPKIGYDILSRSKKLKEIALIVLHHHERWDGEGYPKGLKGDAIPIGSRIIAIADSLDAMLYKRIYRPSVSATECVDELRRNAGTQYDASLIPAAIDACFFIDKKSDELRLKSVIV